MDAAERWRSAIRKIRTGLLVSNSLDTLRDMTNNDHMTPESVTTVRKLGEGAFATVELCKYKSPIGGKEVLVAVKRLRPSILKDRSQLLDFVEETKLLRKLSHRYIVEYIGVGGSGDISLRNAESARKVLNSTFLVQEYVEGGNLRNQVLEQMCHAHTKRKHYSQEQALEWMIQIAKGLRYLHTSKPKVVWRDAKLENILMRKMDGGKKLEACLADFGLSAVLPSPKQHKDSPLLRRSMKSKSSTGNADLDQLSSAVDDILQGHELGAGHSMSAVENMFDLTGRTGSYFYMAPEVLHNEPYNEKADIFSFGVLMYEVLTGTITSQIVVGPTGNARAAEVYAAKVAGGYRRPLPEYLPEALRQIITECWAQNSGQRPNISDVVDRLTALRKPRQPAVANGASREEKSTPAQQKACCVVM
ncbi:hypothetical protein CVIRNUC_009008 [Coccomyxa viridis]|uniref:Protein kinase domain-containing protein n=1 Tax=Coccomyxa viridis TaxID=1274662 RepID=A0AAV1IGH7_9CHLO|nr:hypothetical protein CVIRNUC_009008 [Coccomyxa viridis]